MKALPISLALRETAGSNVNDLYNRAVEGMEDSDIDKIIMDQRANRVRLAEAEAAGTRPKRTRVERGSAPFAAPDELPEI